MKFYTSVHQYGNRVLVRGINNGKRVHEKVEFKPSLFVKSDKGEKYKSLFGDKLDEIQFEDINSAKEYVKMYSEIDNFAIFGNTNYAYQYITKTFPGEVEFDITQLKIWSLDIETSAELGFPDYRNPMEELLLITIQDYSTKEITSFGVKPFTPTKPNHTYNQCASEADLFRKFLNYVAEDHPNILTGWNIEGFDIPYLCARMSKILGDDSIKQLSPWNIVKMREFTKFNKTEIAVDILGVSVLDYLALYKKFTYGAQESYKLDHIAKVELGKEKLSYDEYTSFREFYKKDWKKFVDYNVVDVELVDQLEDKMKLIELILTMAYDAKCNFVDVFSAVRTWDCILWNHLWNKNIIVHQREGKPSRSIVGAYVQEPVPGKYNWIASFDATSLYPSIIMQYNMSPETLVGHLKDTTVDGLLENKYDLSDLHEKDHCMASNGFGYTKEKQGLFPEVVQKLFDDRKKYKKLMLEAQTKYEETKDKSWQKEISKYNNYQMARKIQMNSLYGAWGNEFFRFYDANIAEGITMSGQYIIRKVGHALDEYLNKICGTEGEQYSFYSDTDSCYVTLDKLVQKFFKDQSTEKIVDLLDKICEEKIQGVLNTACNSIADYTNVFDKKIFFKRESIAKSGIWVAKKRYALDVYDNEGVRYKEPKLKVMGLEIVRSSTPEPVRDALKEAVRLILTSTESKLQAYILDFETKYRKMDAERIAFPRGVNGVDKYTDKSSIYKTATPMHVRGALLYNFYLKQFKVDKKYELITEGDKIKFVYLKEPNLIKENCIAFISTIPEELNLRQYVDYDTMFSKSFLEPITTVLNGVGWSAKPQATLEGLFS